MWSYPVDIIFTFEGKDYTLNEFKERVKELKAENAKLRDALQSIVDEYKKPPYTEFDWFAWKQRAEKALGKDGGMG